MQSQVPRWQLWVLGTVAVALVAVVIVRRARIPAPVVRAAQGPGQHPHFVPRHDPKLPQVLMAGLWRTDGGYRATIHIQNALMVAPLSVTPTLYMADGTPLVLPAVEIPASGAASVDINQALATAPAGFAAHVSSYGSAALRYDYDSGGHVAAILMSKDIPRAGQYLAPLVNLQEPRPLENSAIAAMASVVAGYVLMLVFIVTQGKPTFG